MAARTATQEFCPSAAGSSWERTTTAERGNGLLSVPTAQVRSGNFQGLTTVFDPLTGNPDGTGRTPFPNNQVPEARWSFASRTLQNMLPLPNTGTGQNNNFFASAPYYFRRDMIDVKINYIPVSSTNIWGKYSMMDAPVTAAAPLGEALGGCPGGAAGPAGIGTGFNTTPIYSFGVSHVLSPTVLVDGNFNFTIQRELPGAFVLQTGYVGTRSIRQALSFFEANAGLVPGAGAAGRPLFARYGVNADRQIFIPMAHQRYDSWQTNVTRRLSSFVLNASYTWSKSIGLNSGNSDEGLRFYVPSQFHKNRTLSDFDRTHSFTAAVIWELPFGPGKTYANSGLGSRIAGNWQINPFLSIYSGTPFTVTADGASLAAPQNLQVADQISPVVAKLGGVGLGSPFYDPTAFAAVREPRFGNTSPNLLRGPRLANLNLAVFRTFRITEAVNLQFRGEGLNVTNTPALNNPNATVTTPANFMQITAANVGITPQRTMRFGLRLAF